MNRGRKGKMEDKEKTGKKILMPEVFISNYMKQQRNFLKYKREVRINHSRDVIITICVYRKVKVGNYTEIIRMFLHSIK